MAEKILSWNVQDGLGDEARQLDIVDRVVSEDVDIAVFQQAYKTPADQDSRNTELLIHAAVHAFQVEGYLVRYENYDDKDARNDKHGFMAISRLPGSLGTRRYGGRNFVRIEAAETTSRAPLVVYGVHLDDRSECSRKQQVQNLLIESEVRDYAKHVVVAGDFNAMHGDDWRARLLRSWPVRKLAESLPTTDPEPEVTLSKTERFGGLLQRLSQMGAGTVMREFTLEGFTDADSTRQVTVPSKHPFVSLDHILLSEAVEAAEHTVHREWSEADISDHLAISALVRVRQ